MKNLILLPLLLVFGACTTLSDAGYYWGNYASTSYLIVDQSSDQSYRTHAEELNRIIQKSQEKNLKIPPGIYAELGFMYSKLGEEDNAATQFNLEMENYPESRVFLERLIGNRDAVIERDHADK